MKSKIISIITLSLILFTNSCTKDTEIEGCTYETACNYNQEATLDDGNCDYPEEFYDCEGICLEDTDGDGICDQLENTGCNNPNACNYNPNATDDDGSCIYPETYYDCYGNCINDFDNDGICDELEIDGCNDPDACNYAPNATDLGDCEYAEEGYNCDGSVNTFYTVDQLFEFGLTFNEIVNAGYIPSSILVTQVTATGCTFSSGNLDLFGCPDLYFIIYNNDNESTIFTSGLIEDDCTSSTEVQTYTFGMPFNISTAQWDNLSFFLRDDDGV